MDDTVPTLDAAPRPGRSTSARSRPRSQRRRGRIAAAAGAAVLLVTGLAGCTNAVAMSPAPSAGAAACAAAQVRLPAVVGSTFDLRNTNAQSTAAWGSPTAALWHCGVPVPTVSDLPCFSQGSVDWIRDDRGETIVYTTFGRSPAAQVVIDTSKTTAAVLQDLDAAVSSLPTDGHECLDPSEVQG